MTTAGTPSPGRAANGPGRPPIPRSTLALVGASGLVVVTGLWWFGRSGGDLRAPAPETVADSTYLPQVPTSTLSVPVRYELGDVIADLEDAIPLRHGSLDDPVDVDSNDRLSVAYELERTPLTTSIEADTAHVRATIHYRARAWYDLPLLPDVETSCGADPDRPRPRLDVALSAPLRLDSTWTLRGEPHIDWVRAVSDAERDQCEITAFEVDVTDRVVRAAQDALEDLFPRVRDELANIDLRSKFEDWWATLHQPIELSDEVWLIIAPESVRHGRTSGSDQTLVVSVGLQARPQLILGPRPTRQVPPLPPLETGVVEEGLRVALSAHASYDAISRQLNERLAGVSLEREGQVLRVRTLALQGIGAGRVALELLFEGSARGRLYLVGTPEYDRATGQMYVPDLQFDVASSNLLVEGYAWLSDEEITQFLRERARWPVGDATQLAAEQLHRGLNHQLTDSARLEGEVGTVEIMGVFARTDGFYVHAVAAADARLLVN